MIKTIYLSYSYWTHAAKSRDLAGSPPPTGGGSRGAVRKTQTLGHASRNGVQRTIRSSVRNNSSMTGRVAGLTRRQI